MKFHIVSSQKALSISKPSVKKVMEALYPFLKLSCEEIGVYFVTEKKICALHAEFFDDPTPTDCITFPINASYLGDLFICPKTALLYAAKNKLEPYTETTLYLIHGLLHLIGYDDIAPKDRTAMRKMEKKCMDHLKKLGVKLTPP